MFTHLGNRVTLSSSSTPLLVVPSLKAGGAFPGRLISSSWLIVSFGEVRALRSSTLCAARRRVRLFEEEEEEEEEYGYNEEIGMLELYSQNAREEALLVQAMVDGQDVEVLIFKGFSSCLSYRTSPDPSKSILPARAAIKSIDRVKGPFDPSNIEYLQKGLSWEEFKTSLPSKSEDS
ncbi:hypothetical protein PanWU01x14_255220 [Parasponia andersonii]|uniref:DUF7734 domain-containing protein n=1 Tax=Parasponia andersonii TaxID=3476 RepID=A0A2P5BAV7_PARAD|nr:hypothetical protein PanWU01x14_255220 [Parasponia andersonii]